MQARALSNLCFFFEDFLAFIATIEHIVAAEDNNILLAFLNIERHIQARSRALQTNRGIVMKTADLFRMESGMTV
jgi:hypothetical protein